MGGVDFFDQYMSFYNMNHKSRRWWIKILFYLLEACVVNSYIVYKLSMKSNNKKPMSHLKFRSMLVNELISNFCSKKNLVSVLQKEQRVKEIVLMDKEQFKIQSDSQMLAIICHQ